MNSDFLSLTINQAYKTYPFLDDFFLSCAIKPPVKTDTRSFRQWFDELEYFTLDEVGLDRDELPELLERFIFQMLERLNGEKLNVESITIMCGRDKDGNPEVPELTLLHAPRWSNNDQAAYNGSYALGTLLPYWMEDSQIVYTIATYGPWSYVEIPFVDGVPVWLFIDTLGSHG